MGLNYSFMSGIGQEGGSGLVGVQFGSMIVLPLNNDIYTKVGLFYMQGGAHFKSEVATFDLNLQYIQIPVWGKVSINQKNLNMIAGPQFGFLLNATEVENGQKRNITKVLNPLDISANIGIEYALRPNFLMSVYYSIGLTDVTNNRENNNALLNNALTFTLGYSFHL